MKLSDGKGIKTGVWASNEILHVDDINYVGESTYQNITDLMALNASQKVIDEVVSGLELVPDNLMTLKLTSGSAVSFSGAYFNGGAWGFVADPGSVFSVILPDDDTITIANADPTNPRIDVIEIKPIQTAYNLSTRQYKDPITGLITASPTNTRYEYGYEINVIEGTPAVTPVADAKTPGWIKLAEVSVASSQTVLSSSDIIGYKYSSIWTTDSSITLYSKPPTKLESNSIVSIFTTDNLETAQGKIDSVPKNLNGFSVFFEFEFGSHTTYTTTSTGGGLEINGFHSGNVFLQSSDEGSNVATLNFTSYAGVNIKNCSAYVKVSPWLRIHQVDSAGAEGSYVFINITDCYSVSFEGTIDIDAVVYDPGLYPIFVTRVTVLDFPGCVVYTGGGGSADLLILISYCNVSELPSPATPTSFDYQVLLNRTEVRASSTLVICTLGDLHTSSIYYTLLDQVQVDVATNTTDIETNTTDIATNVTDITNLDSFVNSGAFSGSSLVATSSIKGGSFIASGASTTSSLGVNNNTAVYFPAGLLYITQVVNLDTVSHVAYIRYKGNFIYLIPLNADPASDRPSVILFSDGTNYTLDATGGFNGNSLIAYFVKII